MPNRSIVAGESGSAGNIDELAGGGDIPTVNPFSQYAFQPISAPSAPSLLTTTLGKRRPAKGLDRQGGDTPGTELRSPSSSKRVKIYENLQPLTDYLAPDLDIIFCGINPGEQSAQIGHHFANPTNHFWACLHQSGLTSRKLDPREDHKLPQEYSIGLTNLVERPTVEQSELSQKEQINGVPALLEKIFKYKPYVVCFVGLGIANTVKLKTTESRKKGKPKLKADVGLQTYKIVHSGDRETIFYAVSSTSGRVVKYQKNDKIEQFKNLRELVLNVKNGSFDSTSLTEIFNPQAVGDMDT